jgi:hypothetical protein
MDCLVSCGGSIATTRGVFYVAPDGSDKSAGTIDAPFATLAHARDNARGYRAAGSKIYLRAGTYFLDETLQLDMRDSGVSWSAYPGEQVTVSGGTEITGWAGPDAQGRWYAPANLENFRQIYVNGVRATRSRMPLTNPLMTVNSDTITGDAGFVIADDITTWKNPTDMELGLFSSYNQWSQSMCDLQSIASTVSGTYVSLDNPCFYLARHKGGMQVSTSTYLENAIEVLAPGQFYFDRPNHIVYYIPRSGENMKTATVIAPLLQTLLTVTGTIDVPVKDLSFTGIAFGHTSWLEASSRLGFPEIQAAFRIDPSKLITDESLSNPHEEFMKTPGGVVLQYVANATFERCSFVHMGGSGIDIQSGSTGNLISGAKVFDISANGIQIGDVLADDRAPSDPRMIVRGNTVSNSYIHDAGAEFTGAVGIFVGYTAQTTLVHNEVTHLPYTGISIGWGWGLEDPTPARINLVQFNYVHDTMLQRADGGGVYMIGSQPGSSIDSNLIVDNPGPSGGIYLDSGSDGISVTNNVVYGEATPQPDYPTQRPIFIHGSCLVLGCPLSGNIWDDPLATVPNAGLEAPYRDLRAN